MSIRQTSQYVALIKGSLANRKVTMVIEESAGENSSHVVTLDLGRPDMVTIIPATLTGNILEFDPTTPGYVQLLDRMSIKRWSNHLLLYYPITDTFHWQVGWNDFVFRPMEERPSISGSISTVGDLCYPSYESHSCRRFCGKHSKFSSLELHMVYSSADQGTIIIDYKRAYSLPWSHNYVHLPFIRNGSALKVNYATKDLQTFSKCVSGSDLIEYAHIVTNDEKDKITVQFLGSPVLTFDSC